MTELVDLYLRKSNKDGGRSATRQETDLTAEAAAADLTVGRTFVDPDLSASRFARKDRPDYRALLDHIRSGQCRVVGIVESSRGSRTLTQWSQFLDLCRDRKVKIWVQTHDRVYDLSKRRDWKVLAEDGVQSADESELISERTRSGKRLAASQGKPGGRNIYGHLRVYESTPQGQRLKEVVPHPDQAPVVMELVARVAKAEPLMAIANDLNARGIASPGGARWCGSIIRQTVLRPHHVGKMRHGGQVVEAMWPAIVDVKAWNRAVGVLTQPGRRTQRGTVLAYWLSGAVLCGGCRKEYLRVSRRSRYTCTACWGVAASITALETAVEAAIVARLQRPDAAKAFITPVNDSALQAAEDELKELETALQGHYIEARARRLSPQGLAVVEAGLLEDIQKVKGEIRRLNTPLELGEFQDMNIAAEWDHLDAKQRRKVALGLAQLVLEPTEKRGPVFDMTRLDGCRWIGDEKTWGERRKVTKR